MTSQLKAPWLTREENSHSPKHTPGKRAKGKQSTPKFQVFNTLPAFRIQDRVLTRQPLQRWDLNAEDYSHQIAYRAMPAKVKKVQNCVEFLRSHIKSFRRCVQVP